MGGGARIKYPVHVWTPFGGWYNNRPPGWRLTSQVSVGVFVAFSAALLYYDLKHVRYARIPLRPTKYQAVSSHKNIDDYEYEERLEEWNKEKGSFWERITPQK
eukprot:TRINITY_DN394_c0_g1_i1.p1 TRINITY_DN394_c0_g1~~TRINITY_DN394_c0_g1_i1.p1  ORF type:complete len:103 (-),score=25.09 TRINITY_DN394_c0_g1_i1:114-422(-)